MKEQRGRKSECGVAQADHEGDSGPKVLDDLDLEVCSPSLLATLLRWSKLRRHFNPWTIHRRLTIRGKRPYLKRNVDPRIPTSDACFAVLRWIRGLSISKLEIP